MVVAPVVAAIVAVIAPVVPPVIAAIRATPAAVMRITAELHVIPIPAVLHEVHRRAAGTVALAMVAPVAPVLLNN